MAKHSKFENDRRAAETVRMKEIEAAWLGSLVQAQRRGVHPRRRGRPSPAAAGAVSEHAAGNASEPAEARAAPDEGRDEPPFPPLTRDMSPRLIGPAFSPPGMPRPASEAGCRRLTTHDRDTDGDHVAVAAAGDLTL